MPPLRYVILCHDGIDEPHFDLMFETSAGSKLATWRSPTWPIDERTSLVPIAAHRRNFLDFEGEVSGNRGCVRRVHTGEHTIVEDTADDLIVQTETGQRLRLPRTNP